MRLAVATLVALLAFASPALASQVTNLTVVNANPSAGGRRPDAIRVGFTTSATGGLSSAANSRINVTFPAGTTFSGYTSGTVRNVAAAATSGVAPTRPRSPSSARCSRAGASAPARP